MNAPAFRIAGLDQSGGKRATQRKDQPAIADGKFRNLVLPFSEATPHPERMLHGTDLLQENCLGCGTTADRFLWQNEGAIVPTNPARCPRAFGRAHHAEKAV